APPAMRSKNTLRANAVFNLASSSAIQGFTSPLAIECRPSRAKHYAQKCEMDGLAGRPFVNRGASRYNELHCLTLTLDRRRVMATAHRLAVLILAIATSAGFCLAAKPGP